MKIYQINFEKGHQFTTIEGKGFWLGRYVAVFNVKLKDGSEPKGTILRYVSHKRLH